MKVHIELCDTLEEDEITIRCGRMDENILRIHQFISEQAAHKARLIFYKDNQEFYFPIEEVLFFETENEHIYAHTQADTFRIRHRLYELERMLPRSFVRASKSAIVNVRQVYSLQRNITAASLITFQNSQKRLYASRFYYQELRRRLDECHGND